MPGSLGRMFGKAGGMLGPLLLTLAPAMGPLAPLGYGAGGALEAGSLAEGFGNPPPTPTLPSIKAPALASAPMPGTNTPNIPTPAGQGLTLSGGGAGPSPSTGAGVQSSDLINQAIAMANQGPFSQYGAA